MMHIPFDIPKAIDLTDFFPTREEHNRAIHRIHKRLNSCQGSTFLLAALVGLSIGMIIGAIGDQKKRIDDLEEILNKKDETAG